MSLVGKNQLVTLTSGNTSISGIQSTINIANVVK